jgi:hypothetical protein
MKRHIILLIFLLTAYSGFAQSAPRIIHVYVALCDNDSQGIVPVPKKIGNGNDPDNNLYWGCGYGVRHFFKVSEDWTMISRSKNPRKHILERCVYKHRKHDAYLVADAYRGARIKECTIDFFSSASGNNTDTAKVTVNKQPLLLNMEKASLVCYVGHDGLMDFELASYPQKKGTDKKDVIILACASKSYFTPGIKAVGANPLLWTTNLIAPEAYTLKAAIDGWLANESGAQVHERAAQAYDKYQKCGIKGARRLFATGF